MNLSTRSLVVPGIAFATAGVLALAPSVVAPSPTSLAAPLANVPTVQIQDIQLAGIGRDIYNEITTFVKYTVSSAQYWIALVPVVGPPIAEQVGINYFGLIQPVIASTVYYISDVIADPFNFIYWTGAYGANLGFIGYNWASDQAQFFGLPPFLPVPAPPPLASVKAPARGGVTTPSPAAAVEATDEAVVVEAPRTSSRASAVRATRPAASVAAPAATASNSAEPDADAEAVAPSDGDARGEGKAAAGQSGKAAASRAGGRSRG